MTKAQPHMGREAQNNYFDLCIRVENPKTSIYSYCDENFISKEEKTRCKVDTCRVCCVTSDRMKKMNLGMGMLNKCFEKCAQTWRLGKEVQDFFQISK
jgi:hypothetical protein